MKKSETTPESNDGEGASLATIGIQVPVIIKTEVPRGKIRSLNLAQVPETDRVRILGGLLARGLTISLANPWSTTEGSTAEKEAATSKRLTAIQDGSFEFGKGGGGGARLTPEQDAWIEFLTADGHKGVNGKTLEAAKVSKLAAFLVNKGKATTADAKVKAEAELPKWVEWMEQNNPALKTLIAGKRALAGGTMVADDYPG